MPLALVKDFNITANNPTNLVNAIKNALQWIYDAVPNFTDSTKITYRIDTSRSSTISMALEFVVSATRVITCRVYPAANYNFSTGANTGLGSHSFTGYTMTDAIPSVITAVKHPAINFLCFTESNYSTLKGTLGWTTNQLISIQSAWINDTIWPKVFVMNTAGNFYYSGINPRSDTSITSTDTYTISDIGDFNYVGTDIATGLPYPVTNLNLNDAQNHGAILNLPLEVGVIKAAISKWCSDKFVDNLESPTFFYLPISNLISGKALIIQFSGSKEV